jgi:hypothetical protein
VQSKERYEGPNAPGRGKLLCYTCGRPTIEHPVSQPCPFRPVAKSRTPKKVGHTQ